MRDANLLLLSRDAIEPYVMQVIKLRDNVKDVRLSTFYEDTTCKIDGFVTNNDGTETAIQVKTRTIESNNFTISKSELFNDATQKVFCFIDKTFDNAAILESLQMENAVKDFQDKNIKIYAITQKALQNIVKEKKYVKAFPAYYVISKNVMKVLNKN